MEAYVSDWLNLLVRWLHMIAGIAWIGSSFYFVWLDNHLQPPQAEADRDKGVGGELWSVHGGGFYHAQKYKVAPPLLPETLHWFKWEAYTTWLSGMFLTELRNTLLCSGLFNKGHCSCQQLSLARVLTRR